MIYKVIYKCEVSVPNPFLCSEKHRFESSSSMSMFVTCRDGGFGFPLNDVSAPCHLSHCLQLISRPAVQMPSEIMAAY